MKYFGLIVSLFLVILSSPRASLASQKTDVKLNVSGFVVIENGDFALTDTNSHRTYKLRAATQTAQDAMSRLKNYDSLAGSASLVDGVLLLQTVDFVGLRRLLGYWQANSAVINFIDYSRVNFSAPKTQSQYRYAISPGEGDSWNVYFSDQSSVVLGRLSVSADEAAIDFFDSNTGDVASHLELKKVSP